MKTDEIIEVIRNDASLRCRYYDKETGDACVVGGLALAAGIKPVTLIALGGESISRPSHPEQTRRRRRVINAINKKFGLTEKNLQVLQHLNDRNVNTEIRHYLLVDQVLTWQAQQS